LPGRAAVLDRAVISAKRPPSQLALHPGEAVAASGKLV